MVGFFRLKIYTNSNTRQKIKMRRAGKTKINTQSMEQLDSMFKQMLGIGEVNLSVVFPKYSRIREQLTRALAVIDIFLSMSELSQTSQTELKLFQSSLRQTLRVVVQDIGFLKYHDPPAGYQDLFKTEYKNLKDSNAVKMLIKTSDQLAPFATPLKSDSKFIEKFPGISWNPLPFMPSFDIKNTIIMANNSTINRFVISILNKFLEIGVIVYNEVHSPDIDIDQFVQLIGDRLSMYEKDPELNRCKNAFRKIRNSLGLLKQKFGAYYKEFLSTQDSSVFIQNFIGDVASSENGDNAALIREFKHIFLYFKKKTEKSQADPEMREMLNRFNQTFSSVDPDNLEKSEKSENPENPES